MDYTTKENSTNLKKEKIKFTCNDTKEVKNENAQTPYIWGF